MAKSKKEQESPVPDEQQQAAPSPVPKIEQNDSLASRLDALEAVILRQQEENRRLSADKRHAEQKVLALQENQEVLMKSHTVFHADDVEAAVRQFEEGSKVLSKGKYRYHIMVNHGEKGDVPFEKPLVFHCDQDPHYRYESSDEVTPNTASLVIAYCNNFARHHINPEKAYVTCPRD